MVCTGVATYYKVPVIIVAIITPCACTRSKVIGSVCLSVCLSVSTKIAKSQHSVITMSSNCRQTLENEKKFPFISF